MIQLLLDNPVLLLILVAALGYVIGEFKIKGSNLGVAGVLFAGLAVGALHPDLRLPEMVTLLGLVFFVYAIGLSSGAGFFASFRRKGLRDNVLVLCMLLVATAVAVIVHFALGLTAGTTAGLFAGSLTNTPTLAAVLEFVSSNAPPELVLESRNEPVIGYSIAYPVGVVGVIIALFIAQRLWKVDYAREAVELREVQPGSAELGVRTIRVTRPNPEGETVEQLVQRSGWDTVFGRMRRADGSIALTSAETQLMPGDLVSTVASTELLDEVTKYLGESSDERLEMDRSDYDFRRMFVSNSKVAGHALRELDLQQQFGAIVTRIRRGDVEWIAHGDTVLELGDRVRVVAKPENMAAVAKFLGDSYRALSEINLLSLSLGIMAGLLLGLVPIPMPGGVTFRLGLAGGPLIVGLILGKYGRTGPFVWHLPYSANLLLRQIGLVLFFAGVGTQAGHAFFSTLIQTGGITIFAGGAVITCLTAMCTLWVGYRFLHIPLTILSGMVAGLHTQPAVLSYAINQTSTDLPNLGYATVFPVATIAKILLAQLLLVLLS